MYCPSFPEAPTMQTLIVCVPERPGHSVSSDSPLDAAIDEGLRGLGAGSDSMRTTPRSGTFRERSPRRWVLFAPWARIGHVGLRSVAHRRVGHELADLLSTAAGGRDLRGPLQRCLPTGQVEDREPSVELLGLRVRAGGDRPVTGHHDGIDVLGQSAAEHPHACVHGLLDHRMSSLSYGGELLSGDVVHRDAGERNQVSRHLTTPSLGGLLRPHLSLAPYAVETDKPPKTHRCSGRSGFTSADESPTRCSGVRADFRSNPACGSPPRSTCAALVVV